MKLDPARFSLGEYVNQFWTITAEEHTTLDDVLAPEYLGNVASKLRPYDRIAVRTDTGEWYAELLVKSCGRTWAVTTVIFSVDLCTADVEMSQAENFEVRWRGPHLKHCVIRMSDHECIKEGCETKVDAQAWLASYMLTI